MPRITVTSVFVDDQDAALDFYTRVLGFVPRSDVPLGTYRWITVVSPEDPDGPELLLEPDAHPAAKAYAAAIRADGIPAVEFAVDDVEATHRELLARGAVVVQEPTDLGPATTMIVEDTVGNLVQLQQIHRG